MFTKKVIINENQKGLWFKNGKLKKVLGAGKYRVGKNSKIELVSLDDLLVSQNTNLKTLLAFEDVKNNVDVIQVKEGNAVLHYKNGIFENFLTEGEYAFWNVLGENTFMTVDLNDPKTDNVPVNVFSKIHPSYFEKIQVHFYEKAVLYINNKVDSILEPGTYYFWKYNSKIEAKHADMRTLGFNISSQDLLTQDKVSVRISYIGNYRITDIVRFFSSVDDFEYYVHSCAQLALREYVSDKKLDEILESKDEMSRFVFEKMKENLKDISIEMISGAVRDIILPGEIRDIMNTVLVAEKKAQANVIARREEVASTRSLLNTAKLMDENKTLYKLKELEYIERIFENVGNINIGNNTDIISQLTAILQK